MKTGYYDFMGNLVIYEGGEFAYDVDSAEYIPEFALGVCDYLCDLEEGAERYEI